LLKAGFTVHAYNRTPRKLEHLHFDNLTVFDRPDAAVKNADVVVTMLSDDAAVKEISERIVPMMKRGSIHLSMSTISPATATLLASRAQQFGVGYLACPVLGRPIAAENRLLFILLSGPPELKTKVGPLLQAISQRIFDYGHDPASANLVKLMLNYMIIISTGMLSEVMLTAEKTGIDKRILLETMTSTSFGSPIIKFYGALVIEEKETPRGFSTRMASKDLRLMQEAAATQHLTLPLAEVVQAQFREMIKNNGGERDLFMLIQHLRAKI